MQRGLLVESAPKVGRLEELEGLVGLMQRNQFQLERRLELAIVERQRLNVELADQRDRLERLTDQLDAVHDSVLRLARARTVVRKGLRPLRNHKLLGSLVGILDCGDQVSEAVLSDLPPVCLYEAERV